MSIEKDILKGALNYSGNLPYDNDYEAFEAGAAFMIPKMKEVSIGFSEYVSQYYANIHAPVIMIDVLYNRFMIERGYIETDEKL